MSAKSCTKILMLALPGWLEFIWVILISFFVLFFIFWIFIINIFYFWTQETYGYLLLKVTHYSLSLHGKVSFKIYFYFLFWPVMERARNQES